MERCNDQDFAFMHDYANQGFFISANCSLFVYVRVLFVNPRDLAWLGVDLNANELSHKTSTIFRSVYVFRVICMYI